MLDGPLAAFVPGSLIELLRALKLCEARGRRQLAFSEERSPSSEPELFITRNCT